MALANAPVFVKVALILVIVGILVHLIGFATNYWTSYETYMRIGNYHVHADSNSGLWKVCYSTRAQSVCNSVRYATKIEIRKRRQSDGEDPDFRDIERPDLERPDIERDSPDLEQRERDDDENARRRKFNNVHTQPKVRTQRPRPRPRDNVRVIKPAVRQVPEILLHDLEDEKVNNATLPEEKEGWFEATQAFETLGFIAAIAALVLIILYIFVPQTSGKKIVFILSMLACFAAAGCIILGIIIYGSKVKSDLSWSFALCTIAGIIFGVSGILLIVDMLKR